MVLVFFVYGLAFFTMGFAIALEYRRSSDLRLARSLPFLAAFGILHSLAEWADMLLFVEAVTPSPFGIEAVRLARTLLLGLSTVALVQFGVSLLTRNPALSTQHSALSAQHSSLITHHSSLVTHHPSPITHHPALPNQPPLLAPRSLLPFLPVGLGLAWLATLAQLQIDGYTLGSRQWLIHADIWARFLLYLPGSALAGLGLLSEAGYLEKMDFRQVARDARFAAATFLLNAFVAGIVVPSGQHTLNSPINYESFEAFFGIPVQLVRAASALLIAFFVLRVLRVFRFQTMRLVETANKRRLQATLDERERIAREMHDGLAQLIGFLHLKARVTQQLVANRHLEQAERELDQMQKIVQEAYADVRQSILSLRTATELDRGLVAAIRASASDFSEQNSIPVELALAEAGEVSFHPEAEIQLVRIVQEALVNVRKHSRAGRVSIRLERQDGFGVLTVEDDGIGFDPSQLESKNRRCFGLQTMRERAESVGADLQVTPMPGEGTRIQVRFPFEQRATETERSPQNPAG
ncbi:MAG: sensor histidine kinase [Chloroflexota bacterium]